MNGAELSERQAKWFLKKIFLPAGMFELSHRTKPNGNIDFSKSPDQTGAVKPQGRHLQAINELARFIASKSTDGKLADEAIKRISDLIIVGWPGLPKNAPQSLDADAITNALILLIQASNIKWADAFKSQLNTSKFGKALVDAGCLVSDSYIRPTFGPDLPDTEDLLMNGDGTVFDPNTLDRSAKNANKLYSGSRINNYYVGGSSSWKSGAKVHYHRPRANGTKINADPTYQKDQLPKNDYKSWGPQSQNVRDLIGKPHEKVAISTNYLYCICCNQKVTTTKTGDRTKNKVNVFARPNPLQGGKNGGINGTNNVYIGTGSGYCDCKLWWETEDQAQDALAKLITLNLPTYDRYEDWEIQQARPDTKHGYFRVGTIIGPALIQASKLNEDIIDDNADDNIKEIEINEN